MRLADAVGTRVLTRATADEIGRVLHVVVDPAERRIAALHVAGRRRKALLIDWTAVVGFGPDAVVVTDRDALRPPRDERERRVVSGDLELEGRLVLSDAGDAIGTVADVEFDEGSGELLTVVTDGNRHDAAGLLAIGPYCVVLAVAPT